MALGWQHTSTKLFCRSFLHPRAGLPNVESFLLTDLHNPSVRQWTTAMLRATAVTTATQTQSSLGIKDCVVLCCVWQCLQTPRQATLFLTAGTFSREPDYCRPAAGFSHYELCCNQLRAVEGKFKCGDQTSCLVFKADSLDVSRRAGR